MLLIIAMTHKGCKQHLLWDYQYDTQRQLEKQGFLNLHSSVCTAMSIHSVCTQGAYITVSVAVCGMQRRRAQCGFSLFHDVILSVITV